MMNIKKSTTIGSALTRARTAVSDACQASPTSRYLPLLLSTLEALIISLPGETKRLQVLSVTFGVTHISARRTDGGCFPLWEENSWIPFDSFANLVSQESREFAWRTSNWIITDTNLTPLSGSVSAALWLLDKEAGLPYCVSRGGAVATF